jgi:cation-transporting ATPase 13A3/4/5
VKVFRKKNYKEYNEINSIDLVPGDIFAISDKMQIPCDCILVSGDVVLNECMLTGESIPIPKISIYKSD